MAFTTYWIGQSVELRVSFTGPGSAPQVVTGVQFQVRKPDATTATVTAESGGAPACG